MVEAMGGVSLEHHHEFPKQCYTAYLRRHVMLNLFSLKVDASVPDITLEFDKALKMDEMDFTGKDDLSDESIIVYHTKVPRLMVLSSSTEENDIYDWQEKSDEETEWKQVTGRSSLIYQHMKEEEFWNGF
ncbi:hypothetical protein GQX74_011104 [Glossina fuscipes]|nr:hypothetical protein GQX74_011104 [Glossina fuscipes]